MSGRPTASLSLDLDNQWSYMKIHGDPGWESRPSYLDRVVPRVLRVLSDQGLRITFFVIGQDAALARNGEALARLPAAGHEIGNHSFEHEPWLHLYAPDQVDAELARAEDAIEAATGAHPTGFRGPGFSLSAQVVRTLLKRGYAFDASTLPTYIGPMARAYYFLTARLDREQQKDRANLFGSVRDGLRPVGAYRWRTADGLLTEIPVTTIPGVKVPFHLSYVLYLSTFSWPAARAYFRGALAACRVAGVQPSILMHPLDFLGGDDVRELAFFPAMNLPGALKAERAAACLADLAAGFDVVPMGEHARRLVAAGGLDERSLDDLPPGARDGAPYGASGTGAAVG
jgi:peptidoglycan/xylan/chitin deacetylase (PgdA/CDA1 family)